MVVVGVVTLSKAVGEKTLTKNAAPYTEPKWPKTCEQEHTGVTGEKLIAGRSDKWWREPRQEKEGHVT